MVVSCRDVMESIPEKAVIKASKVIVVLREWVDAV